MYGSGALPTLKLRTSFLYLKCGSCYHFCSVQCSSFLSCLFCCSLIFLSAPFPSLSHFISVFQKPLWESGITNTVHICLSVCFHGCLTSQQQAECFSGTDLLQGYSLKLCIALLWHDVYSFMLLLARGKSVFWRKRSCAYNPVMLESVMNQNIAKHFNCNPAIFIRAWNLLRKRGFSWKWKLKIAEKKYFPWEKNQQAYLFLWKLKWWICECKLEVQNWYSLWIFVC